MRRASYRSFISKSSSQIMIIPMALERHRASNVSESYSYAEINFVIIIEINRLARAWSQFRGDNITAPPIFIPTLASNTTSAAGAL